MSEEQLPEEWRGRRVGLLDALLQGRQHVRTRHALWFLTGLETADSLFPFIQGWNARTALNGGAELAWQEFLEGYEKSRGAPFRSDWYVEPLQACQGDDERAALVLLDLVNDYVERWGPRARGSAEAMAAWVADNRGRWPRTSGVRLVGLVEALLWIRLRMKEGQRLMVFTGSDSIESLHCFTIGWVRNSVYNQDEDPELVSFWDWLRNIKNEFPGEGWHVRCLRACLGDHREAALRFLDLVAEFAASRPEPVSS
jgi:hypothetical protein